MLFALSSDVLIELLLTHCPHSQAHNESKNIFKAANTPITLGAVAMLLYVVCQLFSLVGLLALANILNLVCHTTRAGFKVSGFV